MMRPALGLPILVLATACGGSGAPDSGGDASFPDGSSTDAPLSDAGTPITADAAPDADAGPPPASLNDYWNGRARWRLDRGLTLAATGWPYGYGAGAHITVTKDAWYLFGRKLAPSPPAYCQSFETLTLGVQVRRSRDEGATWSDAVEVISVKDGTPQECAATDGDAYFDESAQLWHYLYQCEDRTGVWKGCHATRAGTDPMGPFTPDPKNPVIVGGALWNPICDVASDDCVKIPGGPQRVHDEGTFDIFAHDATGIYFGFHGFDGTNGYRGIAKTKDFVRYVAGDTSQGVPADAIHDKYDAVPWREAWQGAGPIGGGAGSILFDNGFYYAIVETGDLTLGCVDGQNWDWGMSRSATLTSSAWDQLPAGNPFLYSSKLPERGGKSIACNPAYSRLFRDGHGAVRLHTTRESIDPAFAGIFLYTLVASKSLLDNGDLWKCETKPWTVLPIGPTNLVVYRQPNGSSDEGCYLATNCGAATCMPGQSVYQDVAVASVGGQELRFGGKFAVDTGTGAMDVAVLELDSSSAIVATHTVTVNATTTYASAAGKGTLDAKTTRLRFQLYLNNPTTFRADEMYLEVGPP